MWAVIGTSIFMVISPILCYHPERLPKLTFFALFVAFTGSFVGSAFPLYWFWHHLDQKSDLNNTGLVLFNSCVDDHTRIHTEPFKQMFGKVDWYFKTALIVHAVLVVCIEMCFLIIIVRYIYQRCKEYVPKPKVEFKRHQKTNYSLNASGYEDGNYGI